MNNEDRDWHLQEMAKQAAENYEKWPQWMKDLAYFAGREDGLSE